MRKGFALTYLKMPPTSTFCSLYSAFCIFSLDIPVPICYYMVCNYVRLLTMSGATRSFFVERGVFMAEKKKGGRVVDLVWTLAQPLVEGLGLTLWDVKYVKEGANRYLRVVIDKEGGIGLADCVAVNDALDGPLDELDPIEESYSFQVSSPGLERELVRDFHFETWMGRKVQVKLRSPLPDLGKLVKGTLDAYDDGAVTVSTPEGETYTFEKSAYISVKADDFDDDF